MLKSSVKKISRHWKSLCAFAGIIFLINIVYLVSQINRNKPPHATMRDPSTAELHARKTTSRRGADPSHIIHKLVNSSSAKSFTCVDGSKSVELTSFNDDFCDCPDGSDEPGTNACNNGQYDIYIITKYY